MIPTPSTFSQGLFLFHNAAFFQFNPSVRASPSRLTQHLTYNLNRNQSPSPLESKHCGGGPRIVSTGTPPHPPTRGCKCMLRLTALFMGPQRSHQTSGQGQRPSLQGWCWPEYLTEAVHKPTAHRTNLLSMRRGGGTMAEGRLVFPL